jgi:hypothetical protein
MTGAVVVGGREGEGGLIRIDSWEGECGCGSVVDDEASWTMGDVGGALVAWTPNDCSSSSVSRAFRCLIRLHRLPPRCILKDHSAPFKPNPIHSPQSGQNFFHLPVWFWRTGESAWSPDPQSSGAFASGEQLMEVPEDI